MTGDISIEAALLAVADDLLAADPRLAQHIRNLVERLPLDVSALATWRTLDRLSRRMTTLETQLRDARDAMAHQGRVITTLQAEILALQEASHHDHSAATA